MTSLQTNYQALLPLHPDDDDDEEESECESMSQEPKDVVFHVAPKSDKADWNFKDLDKLFQQVYIFHQRHGFRCILMNDAFYLILIPVFIYGLIYLCNCASYDYYQPAKHRNSTSVEKRHITDMLASPITCLASLGTIYQIIMYLVFAVVVYKSFKFIYNMHEYWKIRSFYMKVLKIPPADLKNTTWYEVQCKIREFQDEFIVNPQNLTELDIYHRILRQKNYLVAMVNKNILPIKFDLPIVGETIYFTSGLKYNLNLLFFWGPFSPFKSTWQLKDDYKKYQKRKELADWFSKVILITGIVNLIFLPVIMLYRIINIVFKYVPTLKAGFSSLWTRRWSRYAKLNLRHFNELKHELHCRLSRAYRPSAQYMNIFWSPFTVISARYFASFFGGIFVVVAMWTVIDERMLQVEHVIFIMYVCHRIYQTTVNQLPDENMVFLPETLLTRILADIHYVPDHWKGKAHTTGVKDEFSQLFVVALYEIIQEIICPIVTPFILIFCLRHRALDIVDFFRSFTVQVVNVGDVCSFALMDVSKHGNHHWNYDHVLADQYQQAENGKTELSLMHFTVTNPYWTPPPASNTFINNFKERAQQDTQKLQGFSIQPGNALYTSLQSMQGFGSTCAALANSFLRNGGAARSFPGQSLLLLSTSSEDYTSRRVHTRGIGIGIAEGPITAEDVAMLTSIKCETSATLGETDPVNPLEYRVANMSFNALYLHQLHQEQLELANMSYATRRSLCAPSQQAAADVNPYSDENHPLLLQRTRTSE